MSEKNFLKSIKIHGFRGFSESVEIKLAIPNSGEGSGLTIITGANNSGKSSIIECIKAREGYSEPSFPMGVRNNFVDEVNIEYHFDFGVQTLKSIRKGASETEFTYTPHNIGENIEENIEGNIKKINFFVIQSKRFFSPYFFKETTENRERYIRDSHFNPIREGSLNSFSKRLFLIDKNKEKKDKFNGHLKKILGFEFDWTIDLNESGQYFLRFFSGVNSHSSNGIGEGINSIFIIVDALYDAEEGSLIAIDEPELSLHPSLQKGLNEFFLEQSKDKQIVISTHSPYFIDLTSLKNNAELVRVVAEKGEGEYFSTKVFQLSEKSKEEINKLGSKNIYNPHIWGINARELFFLKENIILVEGQEDVLLYPTILKEVGIKDMPGSFFGWGVGGAGNMKSICNILQDLGFKKVVAVLDNDKKNELNKLENDFENYHFYCIPADDVRTKKYKKEDKKEDKKDKEGLLDENNKLREKYKDDTRIIFNDIREYFKN